jgi:hypothetical protein
MGFAFLKAMFENGPNLENTNANQEEKSVQFIITSVLL